MADSLKLPTRPPDDAVVDRADDNTFTLFPPTSKAGREKLVKSDRAERELLNLNKLAQASRDFDTKETGGPSTGGRNPVTTSNPAINTDSPDQYYRETPPSSVETGGDNWVPPENAPGRPTPETGGDNWIPPTNRKGTPTSKSGGGRGAIDTRWKKLEDQTRVEAYDPYKDMNDERNIHATDPATGAVRPWVNQRVIMDKDGNTIRVDNPVPGAQQSPHAAARQNVYGDDPNANQPNDMTGVLGRAVGWLHRQFHQDQPDQHTQRGYDAMVKDNVGAPDINVADQVFKTVDPNNELPMNRKVELSIRALHDFYQAQADAATDPQQKAMLLDKAGKAPAEMMQFSVKMSKPHGANALAMLQKGDMKGALNEIQAGYGWLGDGHHFEVSGNNIEIVDQNGKTTSTIPITPQYLMNVAAGMASGEYGHDVYRSRAQAGQPPPAPAGRQPWDERVSTAGTTPLASASGSASAYQDTHGDPAAQSPAAPTGPAETPAAPASSSLAPTEQGGSDAYVPRLPPKPGQAINTGAPTQAPVQTPPAPTPPAPTPPAQTPPQGQPVIQTKAPDGTKVIQPSTAAPKQDDTYEVPKDQNGQPQRWTYGDLPPKDQVRISVPGVSAQVLPLATAEQSVTEYYQHQRDEVLRDTAGLPKGSKLKDDLIKGYNKQEAEVLKQIQEQRSELAKSKAEWVTNEKATTKQKEIGDSEAKAMKEVFDTRIGEVIDANKPTDDNKANPDTKAQQIFQNGPLRYSAKPSQQRELSDLAYQIRSTNYGRISSAKAIELALEITQHIPDTTGGRIEKGKMVDEKPVDPKTVFNGKAGNDGARWKVVGRDHNNQPVIKTESGSVFSLPKVYLDKAKELKEQSFKKAHDDQEAALKKSAKGEEIDKGLKEEVLQSPAAKGKVL